METSLENHYNPFEFVRKRVLTIIAVRRVSSTIYDVVGNDANPTGHAFLRTSARLVGVVSRTLVWKKREKTKPE